MGSSGLKPFQNKVNELAAVIKAPAHYLPTYGRTEDGARPHIEFSGEQFHYVVVERGQELERRSSPEADDILYHVFDGVSFAMATHHEVRNRRPGEDFRRQLFGLQLKLLGKLSPDWERRTRARLDDVLRRHPFEDVPG